MTTIGIGLDVTQAVFEAMVPNGRFTHIFDNVFPRLREMGVSQADLDRIVSDNPRRYRGIA